jgi:hypothetical protein
MKYMPPETSPLDGKEYAGIQTPLINASDLSSREQDGLIFRNRSESQKREDEIFSIYLTDAYIKYMQDMFGLNELLFLFEFTEVVEGTETDTVTKILGPYESVADATFAPLKNKLIYGPKLMKSDVVSMKLTVLEFDGEENEENTSILDFIQNATQTFKLANPVTASQLQLTTELSKTLLQTNTDEVVMTIDIDFVAGNEKYDKQDNKAQVIPLQAGQMLFVKREACRLFVCFDYMRTKNGTSDNFFGAFADLLFFPIVAGNRTFFDSPDSASLSPFDFDEFNDALGGRETVTVSNANHPKRQTVTRVSTQPAVKLSEFREKSWLLFNIVKGGDDSLWDKRKIIQEAEQSIIDLLNRKTDLSDVDTEALDERFGNLINSIKEEQLFLKMGGLTIYPESTKDGKHTITLDANNADFCLSQEQSYQYSSIQVLPNSYELVALDNAVNTPIKRTGLECFDLRNSDKSQITGNDIDMNLVVSFAREDLSVDTVHIPLIINPNE